MKFPFRILATALAISLPGVLPLLAGTVPGDAVLTIGCDKTTPHVDGRLTDECWRSANWSNPFAVDQRPDPNYYGAYLDVDKKFSDRAATAALSFDEKNLYVAIVAPFPEDVPPRAEGREHDTIYYDDDCYEFFIRANDHDFFQWIINGNGAMTDIAYFDGSSVVSWESGAVVKTVTEAGQVVIEMAIPREKLPGFSFEDGVMLYGNIVRSGAAGGGRSTWAPVGTSNLNSTGFGRFIIGSIGAYLNREAEQLNQRVNTSSLTAEEQTAIRQRLQALRDTAADISWAEGVARLHECETMLEQFKQKRSYLVWEKNLWENVTPTENPTEAKPLEMIAIESPVGCRAVSGFVITNFSSKPMLARLSLSMDDRDFDLNRVAFREVSWIEVGESMRCDPIFDLPQDCMIRVAPKSSVKVMVDVNLSGLKPQEYRGKLTVIPAYDGFEPEVIPFVLTAVGVDLRSRFYPNFTYHWANNTPGLIRELGRYEINTIYVSHNNRRANMLPLLAADGTITPMKFDGLDQIIDEYIAAGIRQEEINFVIYTEFKNRWLFPGSENPPAFFSEPWKRAYTLWLTGLRDHLRERYNIGYDRFCISLCDETTGDPDDPESTNHLAKMMAAFHRSIDPKIRLMLNPMQNGDNFKNAQPIIALADVVLPDIAFLVESADANYRENLKKTVPEIRTYGVLSNTMPVNSYRNFFWKNLQYGFSSVAGFWSLECFAGECFNTKDSDPMNDKSRVDYGTMYMDEARDIFTPSLRMEAWYQGYNDYRLADHCRLMIAELAAAGDPEASDYQRQWQSIVDGVKNFEQGRHDMLELAKRLLNRRAKR